MVTKIGGRCRSSSDAGTDRQGAEGWIALTNGVVGGGQALYRAVVDADLEGIVAKRLADVYQPKTDGPDGTSTLSAVAVQIRAARIERVPGSVERHIAVALAWLILGGGSSSGGTPPQGRRTRVAPPSVLRPAPPGRHQA